ncbi:hypothetical protein KY343_07270 [Candidatus Woesearchaeota archaeon]|nr:hypothetical protein [Candidatus Woesearchaeota archaeon]
MRQRKGRTKISDTAKGSERKGREVKRGRSGPDEVSLFNPEEQEKIKIVKIFREIAHLLEKHYTVYERDLMMYHLIRAQTKISYPGINRRGTKGDPRPPSPKMKKGYLWYGNKGRIPKDGGATLSGSNKSN